MFNVRLKEGHTKDALTDHGVVPLMQLLPQKFQMKGGEKSMPKGDGTGPPDGAQGPKNGQGGGNGGAPGAGTGPKTGELGKGDC